MNSIAAACTGKVAFASFKLAQEVTSRPNSRKTKKVREPYHCTNCQQWHVGHPKKTGKTQIRINGSGHAKMGKLL
jgi:LEA14-like dessication related protein